jgi:hypothetical protein
MTAQRRDFTTLKLYPMQQQHRQSLSATRAEAQLQPNLQPAGPSCPSQKQHCTCARAATMGDMEALLQAASAALTGAWLRWAMPGPGMAHMHSMQSVH